LGKASVSWTAPSRSETPIIFLLFTAAGSEFVLRFSSAKKDTLTETVLPTFLLAFFSGGLDRSLFLEFACHATGASGIFLCIMAACVEAVKQLLGTGNLALGLF
jgi:hypothetical protein